MLVQGNCTSSKAYPVTGCGGMCESGAMAAIGGDGYTSQCSCCQPTESRNEVVPMTCSDGTAYEVIIVLCISSRSIFDISAYATPKKKKNTRN